MLRLWSRLTAQALDFRAKHPEREAQFVDLQMDEITDDPLGSVERCYEHFGYPLTAAAEGRMRLYLASHPKHEFGEHHYALADFGLDAEEIRASFALYRERFGVRDEPFGEA
jgi:hypothetical protein